MRGEMIPKDLRSFAYIIPGLPGGINLHIRRSANAWWMDREKVYALLFCFRINSTIKEACQFAHITSRQYKYFRKFHPQIDEIYENYFHLITLKARRTVVKNLDTNLRDAWWWLQRKRADEFGRRTKRSKNQGLIDWEKKHRPVAVTVVGPDSKPIESEKENPGGEGSRSEAVPNDPTLMYTVNGLKYTEEEYNRQDFEELCAERERAQAQKATQ